MAGCNAQEVTRHQFSKVKKKFLLKVYSEKTAIKEIIIRQTKGQKGYSLFACEYGNTTLGTTSANSRQVSMQSRHQVCSSDEMSTNVRLQN